MKEKTDKILIGLSIVSVAISAYVSLSKNDFIGLAGTQWMLIGIVLGIYGLYAKKSKIF